MNPVRVWIFVAVAACLFTVPGYAQQRIYTAPDPAETGGVEGRLAAGELTHAIVIDHDRKGVYLGELSDGGRAFRFAHLPVGKYDLLLLTKSHLALEGISLGDNDGAEVSALPAGSMKNLQARIEASEKFFNRCHVARIGIEGDRALAFVERIRDQTILRQSGEKLDANLRRFEVMELARAENDWQTVGARLLYREPEPLAANPAFFKHAFVPALGNLRIVNGVKKLDPIALQNY